MRREVANLEQADGRRDHDGRERAARQALQQIGREDQEQRHADGADDAGDLRLRARRFRDRRPRRAAADRKSLKQSRGEVGGAEPHHLLVRIDRRAHPGRVGARQHAGVGERDHGDGAPPITISRRCSNPIQGSAKDGSPCGNGPSTLDAGALIESEPADHERRADDRDQQARDSLERLEQHDQRERAGADRERGPVGSGRRAPPRRSPPGSAADLHASIEKPSSFGSWLTRTVNAIPFM